jgi:hypothetical protein
MLSLQPNVDVVGCHHDCTSSRIYCPIFHALLTCRYFNKTQKWLPGNSQSTIGTGACQ